jgi:hypothetical protein
MTLVHSGPIQFEKHIAHHIVLIMIITDTVTAHTVTIVGKNRRLIGIIVIEDLLIELSNDGWSVSWAFQFAPDHWRVSIIHHSDIGEPSGTYVSFCADAPTFAEALEDAILRRNDNPLCVPSADPTWIPETPTSTNLLTALGLHIRQPKIDRRI